MKIPVHDSQIDIPAAGPLVRGEVAGAGAAYKEAAELGMVTNQIISHINAKRKKDEDLNFVTSLLPRAETEWNEYLVKSQQEASEGGAGFTEGAKNFFATKKEEWLANAPSAEAKHAALTHLSRVEVSGIERALTFENKQRLKYNAQVQSSSLEELRKQAMRDPSSVHRLYESGIWSLDQAAKPGGWLNPDEAIKIKEDYKHGIYHSAFMGYLNQNPIAANDEIKSGKWDSFFDSDMILKLQDTAQRRVDHENGVEKARLPGLMRDNLSSIRQTGQPVSGVAEKVFKVGGQVPGEEHYNDMSRAATFFNASQNIAFMPYAQAVNEIEKLRPAAGTEQYHDNAQLHAELRAYLEDREKILKDDPVVWAMRSPRIVSKFLGPDGKVPDPGKQEINLSMFDLIPDRIAEQKSLGLPDHKIRALTNEEAASWASHFDNVPPEDRPSLIGSLVQQSGPNKDTVWRDLVRGGLDPLNHALVAVHGTPWAARIAPIIAEAIKQGPELKKNLPEGQVKKVENAVREAFAPFRQTIIAADLSGRRTTFANEIEEAVTRAAFVLAQKGVNGTDAGERAVKEIISNRYHPIGSGDTYRVPIGFDPERVKKYTAHLINELNTFDVLPHGSYVAEMEALGKARKNEPSLPTDPYGLGLGVNVGSSEWFTPEFQQRHFTIAVQNGGYWVTNESESGLVLLDPLGLPVLLKDGTRVQFPFQDAQTYIPEYMEVGMPVF
ncbi:MAG: hypothetical protein WAW37_05880 [Syntrophobacteraceae bacterium]